MDVYEHRVTLSTPLSCALATVKGVGDMVTVDCAASTGRTEALPPEARTISTLPRRLSLDGVLQRDPHPSNTSLGVPPGTAWETA